MSEKVLALRRPDTCAVCGCRLEAGTQAKWDPQARTVSCLHCDASGEQREHAPHGPVLIESPTAPNGVGGASAQREFDRRHDARQERVITNHPKIGRILLALVDDAPSTKVWAQGAAGERAVAERLETIENGLVLHDRRLRRADGRLSQANIDHIAIVPSGVWVIDAKTHKGRLEVRRTGGLFTPRVEQLRINGRDQSKLVDGARRQVEAVRVALWDRFPSVPVSGAMCFVGTEMPWLDEDIDGVALRGRRGLTKLLNRPGTSDFGSIQEIHQLIAERFPPA